MARYIRGYSLISGGGEWLSDVRKNNLTIDMQEKYFCITLIELSFLLHRVEEGEKIVSEKKMTTQAAILANILTALSKYLCLEEANLQKRTIKMSRYIQ